MKKIRKKSKKESAAKKPKLDQIKSLSPNEILNPLYTIIPANDIEEKISYQNNIPFCHVALKNFTTHQFAVEALKQLKEEKWFVKRNDLYTFRQTDDLKNTIQPCLRDFREALYSDIFRNYLHYITGITLNNKVDVAGQLYRQGGNLLCHDDELDGRRIAFIWYLVPEDWTEQDGGQFCLYDNDKGNPSVEPVKRFTPMWNTLLFFETTPTTWHQVSEVLSKDKERYSISGWFHGDVMKRPEFPKEELLSIYEVKDLTTGWKLEEWISDEYLKEEAQEKILAFFEGNSSIGLNNFLIESKYDAVLEELKHADWKVIGPPNRRHYGTLGRWKSERETNLIKQLKDFLKSTEFINFVSKLTGLTIQSVREGEVRKFGQQDYTLAHDNEQDHQTFGLDIHLNFQDPQGEWEDIHGGFTTYMDSDTELLALALHPNVLSLVYRDVGCMKFVKFLTSSIPSPRYDIVNTFNTLDNPPSEENENDDPNNPTGDDDPDNNDDPEIPSEDEDNEEE